MQAMAGGTFVLKVMHLRPLVVPAEDDNIKLAQLVMAVFKGVLLLIMKLTTMETVCPGAMLAPEGVEAVNI